MSTPSALQTLIELATTESDEAAKRLGKAVALVEDAQQKLAMLEQYRDDYRSRLDHGMSSGITASGYRNFQLFLDKLDDAIKGQQRILDDARMRVERERESWQESERKRMSYGTLADRAEKKAQQVQNKRDQKMMDEFATRQAHKNR
ncbi:flagellar FliJ protein [Noviherbaspirillum humi]|uniref:Flagellar FliJ protein n=1 Tax=Noviherbaspirillum humi TaxID=1688639 RepID=A0A239FWN6_9BURK|nr:flagellar export protein FliJ [Noviherbaspirillum humi]SNS61447.1 flagellar FliJ protein [Noviherbaspirillum humi]